MIGGVRNFKAAMESENSAKGSHVPDKLYFDEAMGDGPEAGKDYLLSLMSVTTLAAFLYGCMYICSLAILNLFLFL